MLAHNCIYLWTKKQAQFLARAAPTEQLVDFVRHSSGPVYVHCFPYGFDCAEWAVELRLRKKVERVDSAAGANFFEGKSVFCMAPAKHLHPRPTEQLARTAADPSAR